MVWHELLHIHLDVLFLYVLNGRHPITCLARLTIRVQLIQPVCTDLFILNWHSNHGKIHGKERVSLQSTAGTACRDMGFETGVLRDEVPTAEVLPPWLSGIRCAGPEAEVGACRRSVFGDTSSCGAIQRLSCVSTRALFPLPKDCAA